MFVAALVSPHLCLGNAGASNDITVGLAIHAVTGPALHQPSACGVLAADQNLSPRSNGKAIFLVLQPTGGLAGLSSRVKLHEN